MLDTKTEIQKFLFSIYLEITAKNKIMIVELFHVTLEKEMAAHSSITA